MIRPFSTMVREPIRESTVPLGSREISNPATHSSEANGRESILPTLPPEIVSFSISTYRRTILLFLMLMVVVGCYYVGVKGEGRSAINRWTPQVRALWAGEDIYLKYGFPTPPIMVIILTPFCLLPGIWVMASWFALKTLLTTRVLMQSLRWSTLGHGIISSGALILAAAIFLRPVIGDLQHGNVNLWILFLVVSAVGFFRERRDVLAGVTLALAIACKLTPALLVVYFAWKRAWTLVASTLLGLALWLFLVPAALLGTQRNAELLSHWADYMVWPYVQGGSVDVEQTNQSAGALLHRLLTPTTAIEGNEELPETSVAALTWNQGVVSRIWIVVVAGLMAGLAWICRRRWPDRQHVGWLHELGIIYLAMLLISERSWKHHFVWLLPITVLLAAAMTDFYRDARTRAAAHALLGLLGFTLLCLFSTSQDFVRPIAGEYGAKLMQAYGAYVWAALALIAAHVISLGTIFRRAVRLS